MALPGFEKSRLIKNGKKEHLDEKDFVTVMVNISKVSF